MYTVPLLNLHPHFPHLLVMSLNLSSQHLPKTTKKNTTNYKNPGLKTYINFFIRGPDGDLWEKFGCQIINFGRHLTCMLYVIYIRTWFACKKSNNWRAKTNKNSMSKTYKATDYCCSKVICLWFEGDGFFPSYFKWSETQNVSSLPPGSFHIFSLLLLQMQLFIFN